MEFLWNFETGKFIPLVLESHIIFDYFLSKIAINSAPETYKFVLFLFVFVFAWAEKTENAINAYRNGLFIPI